MTAYAKFISKIKEIYPKLLNAHYIDLIIRLDGEDVRIEFDFLKGLAKDIEEQEKHTDKIYKST